MSAASSTPSVLFLPSLLSSGEADVHIPEQTSYPALRGTVKQRSPALRTSLSVSCAAAPQWQPNPLKYSTVTTAFASNVHISPMSLHRSSLVRPWPHLLTCPLGDIRDDPRSEGSGKGGILIDSKLYTTMHDSTVSEMRAWQENTFSTTCGRAAR